MSSPYNSAVRIVAGFAATSYGLGLIVWNIYLSTLGVSEISLTKAQYLLTGLDVFLLLLPPMSLGIALTLLLAEGNWRKPHAYVYFLLFIIWQICLFSPAQNKMFGGSGGYKGLYDMWSNLFVSRPLIPISAGLAVCFAAWQTWRWLNRSEFPPLTSFIKDNEELIEDTRKRVVTIIEGGRGDLSEEQDWLRSLRKDRSKLYREREESSLMPTSFSTLAMLICFPVWAIPSLWEYATYIHPQVDYSLGGGRPRLVLTKLSPEGVNSFKSFDVGSDILSPLYGSEAVVLTSLFYETSRFYVLVNPLGDNPKPFHLLKSEIEGMSILDAEVDVFHRRILGLSALNTLKDEAAKLQANKEKASEQGSKMEESSGVERQ